MSVYASKLAESKTVTFRQCYSLAKELVPPHRSRYELTLDLGRGTKILQTEDQLNAYLVAYGGWHHGKILSVLPKIPKGVFEKPFDLVDWGCGQGIELLALGKFIGEKSKNLRIATLIEPSKIALDRAELHASLLFKTATIRKINKRFEDLAPDDFSRPLPVPRIHFFSNVLDMEIFKRPDNNDALKSFFRTLRDFAFAVDEYFICVSPTCSNQLPKRFEKFLSIIHDDKRWKLTRLFHCFMKNSRPTILADVVHYESRIHCGERHYAEELELTAFHDLVAGGDLRGIELLLDRGADIDHPDAFGIPPLLHAVEADELNAADLLLSRGANINTTNPSGETALYLAAKAGNTIAVKILLDRGADPEVATKEMEETPLMAAIQRHQLETVKILLRAGCRTDIKNARGLSPAKLCKIHGAEEILDLLEDTR